MKREKEVPAELLAYLEERKVQHTRTFDKLNIFCSLPVRAVRMKILVEDGKRGRDEDFRTVIIPPVDIYTRDKAILKSGFLKRDALFYFVADTHKAFPLGHVYDGSGAICLGNIFVPSAVPERSAAMPLETLFLHNDRNLSHGGAHLAIKKKQAEQIHTILKDADVELGTLGMAVIDFPGRDIIQNDEIWSLSADVAEQKSLPEALRIMKKVYHVVFPKDNKPKKNEEES